MCVDIVDAFSRMIVGWRVASHMRTDMVLDGVSNAMARRSTRQPPPSSAWSRTRTAGSPFGYLGALHRTSRRDRCSPVDRDRRRQLRHRTLAAQTTNGLYKTECVYVSPTLARPSDDVTDLRARHPRLGCTGSTTNASTATAATGHRSSSTAAWHQRQRERWLGPRLSPVVGSIDDVAEPAHPRTGLSPRAQRRSESTWHHGTLLRRQPRGPGASPAR